MTTTPLNILSTRVTMLLIVLVVGLLAGVRL